MSGIPDAWRSRGYVRSVKARTGIGKGGFPVVDDNMVVVTMITGKIGQTEGHTPSILVYSIKRDEKNILKLILRDQNNKIKAKKSPIHRFEEAKGK